MTGLVDQKHPLVGYLRNHGFSDADLAWFHENTAFPDVMGVNYYPMWSNVEYFPTGGGVSSRARNDGTAGLEEVIREVASRYGVPVMVTETSHAASVAGREGWMDESVGAVRSARARGVRVVGYTWFPIFSLVVWAYRRGGKPAAEYLGHMGLWDLRDDGEGTLLREPTRLVERYAGLVTTGSAAVGRLEKPDGPGVETEDHTRLDGRRDPGTAAVIEPAAVYTPAASIPARPARPT